MRTKAPMFWLAVCCSVALMAGPTPATAQGFFESLFGFKSAKPKSRAKLRGTGSLRRSRFPNAGKRRNIRIGFPLGKSRSTWRGQRSQRGGRNNSGDARQAHSSTRYRTYCVRACDGYYFPISHAVRRGKFYRDANSCKSKCGDKARLYYVPGNAGPADMVDLKGLTYAKTSTAFLFRKKLVAGCRCKPQPWAQSERDRHAMYELNESAERRKARLAGDAEALAGLKKNPGARTIKIATLETNAAENIQAAQNSGADAKGTGQETNAGRFGTLPGRAFGDPTPDDERIDGGDRAFGASTLPPTAEVQRKALQDESGEAAQKRVRRGGRRRIVRSRSGRRAAGRRVAKRSRRRRGRSARAKAKTNMGSFWGLGSKPKYRWPGD